MCGREAELDRPNANDGEHEVLWAGNWPARSLAPKASSDFLLSPDVSAGTTREGTDHVLHYKDIIKGQDTWCTQIGSSSEKHLYTSTVSLRGHPLSTYADFPVF